MNRDEAIIIEIAGIADYRDDRGWPRRIFISGGIFFELRIEGSNEAILMGMVSRICGIADYRDGRGWPRRIFIAGGIILEL